MRYKCKRPDFTQIFVDLVDSLNSLICKRLTKNLIRRTISDRTSYLADICDSHIAIRVGHCSVRSCFSFFISSWNYQTFINNFRYFIISANKRFIKYYTNITLRFHCRKNSKLLLQKSGKHMMKIIRTQTPDWSRSLIQTKFIISISKNYIQYTIKITALLSTLLLNNIIRV